MKKYLALSILIAIFSYFSFFELVDYKNANNAKNAYISGDYEKAISYYGKLKSKEAKFNQANAFYKLNDFNKTIEILNELNLDTLEFEKLHNLGNSFAKLNKIDEGIDAYEKALMIKDDNDTRYNLELLKSLKKKQVEKENEEKEEKENQDSNKTPKDNDKKDDQSTNSKQKQSQSNKTPKKNKSEKQDETDDNSDEHDMKNQQDSNKHKDSNKKKEDEEKLNSQKNVAKLNEKSVNIEEKKWQKLLDERDGIQTLIVPFNKKEDENEEIKPW
ncbi:hypothetical protein CBLAS_0575 [Campylobacter blaseri]|uniref:Uncharacterized protein n=1 Tax=Campylobacter blaseri TaxID=2042961 RepID=A0A2P8R069_9BACT|nr:tetratricopeptide repeat protein [Campylobacter blaseri]PSM51895.1 hypothetical protein CQ405_04840 [Campylobacter blaseri]PSM53679.1 hypothetical protein CRN67_04840 [Campylobacter blaseri]QKF85768.1 hypothetical protein CBLAS_0575 [Campylobacter blaseri]